MCCKDRCVSSNRCCLDSFAKLSFITDIWSYEVCPDKCIIHSLAVEAREKTASDWYQWILMIVMSVSKYLPEW